MPEKKPTIDATKNGPYFVRGPIKMRNSKGNWFEEKKVMALCRCGHSTTKPYCSGMHSKVGFKGDKEPDTVLDKVGDYVGEKITIHDNRGVCAHSAFCTDNVPTVWRLGEEPWIDPDGSDPVDIEAVTKLCPSGALSYTREGIRVKDHARSPFIKISKNGPYRVVGGPELIDKETGSTPESKEHFSLCRCGSSKNKPFCSGMHWYVKFKDDKN
jgi:CDGSH-type Zn-finger protein